MKSLQPDARAAARRDILISLAVPAYAADPGVTDDEIVIGLFGPLSGAADRLRD